MHIDGNSQIVFYILLQGRRAVAIRAIDQKRGGMPNEGHFYERKIALLAKEDQIEADFEKIVCKLFMRMYD